MTETALNNLFDLSGNIALITGSSGGLGLVMARGLASCGASVILHGRNPEKIRAAAEAMAEEDFDVGTCIFDVSDAKAVKDGVEAVTGEHGAIDILVNNAGMQHRSPLEDLSEEGWDSVMSTNLKGPWLMARAVVGGMKERWKGKIINICSIQSELGRPTIAPYAASKGGLKMLTRGMAVEWAKHNIQVNGIGPGYFKTDMTRALYEDTEFDRWLCSRTPSNRWGNPEELIGALVFLASDASSYVNGQILYVDGGLLASV